MSSGFAGAVQPMASRPPAVASSLPMVSLRTLSTEEAAERVERLEVPFNRYGLDPFGISKDHLAVFYTSLGLLYRHYFRCRTFGIEHVPARGRAMFIGNHSGGLPVDGGMLLSALFWEMDPPRHAHGMVEYFAQSWPFVSSWFSRVGQLPGLPEHAVRFLEADRVLMVFPEGARGTGKLYKDRYKLVRFGTGFLRIAMRTGTPIVPFAFLGGEEALRTVYHAPALARMLGAPYIPIPPWLVPLPLPFPCEIHVGEPMVFEGTGRERDEVIEGRVEEVRERIEGLIEAGREQRRSRVRAERGR